MNPVYRSIFERAVLIDTSALYALADQKDNRHEQATECLHSIAQFHLPVWVTNFTIAEAHRLILHNLGTRIGLSFLEDIYAGGVAIERVLETDEQQARNYLKRFADQSISYTDAISFATMKRLGIGKAFTFDWHFRLLGFVTIPPFYI